MTLVESLFRLNISDNVSHFEGIFSSSTSIKMQPVSFVYTWTYELLEGENGEFQKAKSHEYDNWSLK